jgi:hypothetical protein
VEMTVGLDVEKKAGKARPLKRASTTFQDLRGWRSIDSTHLRCGH